MTRVKILGTALVAGLFAQPAAAPAAEPPPAFKICASCHAIAASKPSGPMLQGVTGRKAGGDPAFKYSPAMLASGLVWDDANLAKYIANPKTAVPGNKMLYPGMKDPAEIQAVIDFLKTQK